MQSGLTQGFTLGYGLKVSPSGLHIERIFITYNLIPYNLITP